MISDASYLLDGKSFRLSVASNTCMSITCSFLFVKLGIVIADAHYRSLHAQPRGLSVGQGISLQFLSLARSVLKLGRLKHPKVLWLPACRVDDITVTDASEELLGGQMLFPGLFDEFFDDTAVQAPVCRF